MKTIVIAGGTGFLGKILEHHFKQKGYHIKILTRKPTKANHIYWNGKELGPWTTALESAEALINLAGKSVNCRYTKTNKKSILESRIDSTQVLGLAINLLNKPPKVWLNSSTATIYKDSYKKEMTEDNGEIGDDFSMNVATSWEASFNNMTCPETKKIILRTSIVLGKNGGAFIPLKRLVQFGLGGKQWHGKQRVSWIHEFDFARVVEFLITHKKEGAYNVSAPNPTDNSTLMQVLRQAIGIPFGIGHPKWLLELGARLIGTETELVLKSRNVIPKRLLDDGFKFKFKNISDAIIDIQQTS